MEKGSSRIWSGKQVVLATLVLTSAQTESSLGHRTPQELRGSVLLAPAQPQLSTFPHAFLFWPFTYNSLPTQAPFLYHKVSFSAFSGLWTLLKI